MTIFEPIDVITCTWNSNSPYFRSCLLSIKKGVPLNNFIVIDRFSTDGTIKTIQEVIPTAKIIQTDANLAHARTIGIKHVTTKFFAFIDDDILLNDTWFTILMSAITNEKQVGAIQGIVRYGIDYLDKEQTFILQRSKQTITQITGRGYTHNTILLTEIMKDFNPPQSIHSWEDFLMTQHIIKKGYIWLETNLAQPTHYRDYGENYTEELRKYYFRAKWDAAGNRLVHSNIHSISREVNLLLLNSLRQIMYSVVNSIAVLDPRLVLYHLLGQIGYLKGFLSPSKNAIPYELRSASRK